MKNYQILLVEDNEGDIMLTLEAFEECNFNTEIQIARNGKEATHLLFETQNNNQLPDLILLDINLPLLNGHEVLKKIKENEKTKKNHKRWQTNHTNRRFRTSNRSTF